jgi:hypothetical protein
MQMVQHHVIYSPEKNNSHNQDTCNHTHIKHKYNQASSHSVRSGSSFITSEWALLLLLFSSCCPCLCSASTAHLSPSQAGQAQPFPLSSKPVPFSPGSRQLPLPMSGTLNMSGSKHFSFASPPSACFFSFLGLHLPFRNACPNFFFSHATS